jgi:thiosulfate dehydrogenase (quinone) large subunit
MGLVSNFKQSTSLGYLALVRFAVGYHFLGVAIPKLSSGFLNGKVLANQLAAGIGKDPFAWHRAFIQGQVLPHAHLFNYLTTFGELAIGLSLVTGCLVRVASFFGAFYQANILLSVGFAAGGALFALNRLYILLHVIFVLASAGRAWGLDCLLKKGFPKSRLF